MTAEYNYIILAVMPLTGISAALRHSRKEVNRMPKRYYKHNKKDIQHQIDALLQVYDFLGRQNRKKELPKSVKNAEKNDNKQGVEHEVQR